MSLQPLHALTSEATEANEAALLKAQQGLQASQAGGLHCNLKWCWWLDFLMPLVARVYNPPTLILEVKEAHDAALLLQAQQEMQAGSHAHCIAICVTWWVALLLHISCCS